MPMPAPQACFNSTATRTSTLQPAPPWALASWPFAITALATRSQTLSWQSECRSRSRQRGCCRIGSPRLVRAGLLAPGSLLCSRRPRRTWLRSSTQGRQGLFMISESDAEIAKYTSNELIRQDITIKEEKATITGLKSDAFRGFIQ
ncbi:hypothetical protein FGO68_gene5690 [Halteria grandinella]|uniref:Uncharacterized protein n=1 Tax=Halteria grandinella TaxID=5974 RepID=A0A8J8SX41_HALGN|nr:hypothetical protein FGO68_gene5690 [Halteria grandinella]